LYINIYIYIDLMEGIYYKFKIKSCMPKVWNILKLCTSVIIYFCKKKINKLVLTCAEKYMLPKHIII